jgi:hypothetical protein
VNDTAAPTLSRQFGTMFTELAAPRLLHDAAAVTLIVAD